MEPVKTEFSAISNVMMQYEGPLGYGLVGDPEAGLETLRQQLKAAGSDKVLEELQNQIDAFVNN
jgi:putative aldouronate transport system substrate-binding protein